MRPVILSVMLSLDGKFDGPGDGAERIDWFQADQEWLDYSVDLLDRAGTLLFGRVTFDGMAAYWPHQADPVAERMNRLDKVGFSRSPRTTTWRNARWSTDAVAEVARLTEAGAGDIVIMGSGTLALQLAEHDLIDEYRFAVNPVALGAGADLFPPGTTRMAFERRDVRLFNSGIVEVRCTRRAGP